MLNSSKRELVYLKDRETGGEKDLLRTGLFPSYQLLIGTNSKPERGEEFNLGLPQEVGVFGDPSI